MGLLHVLFNLGEWCDLNLADLLLEGIDWVKLVVALLKMWLDLNSIKQLNRRCLWRRWTSKELSLTLKILGIHVHLFCHGSLVVWTTEKDWVLETEWTLLSNEAIEVFVSEISTLIFVFLESLNTCLFDDSLVLSNFWCFKWSRLFRGVAWDLKTIGLVSIFLAWDVKVSQNVTLDTLEWLGRVPILTAVLYTPSSIYFLSLWSNLLGSGLLLPWLL